MDTLLEPALIITLLYPDEIHRLFIQDVSISGHTYLRFGEILSFATADLPNVFVKGHNKPVSKLYASPK